MSLFRSRGFVLVALIYAALSLACTQIPLLNYLGYEFSALIGFVGSILASFLTIRVVKPVYLSDVGMGESRAPDVRLAFRQAIAMNAAVLVIPLGIMLTNALFVKNCSLLQGLTFFLLIPVVSAWFGSALGLFCAVHYRFSKTAVLLSALVFLMYSLGEGYFTPAIFSYNFLYGYFPGLTYDEVLDVSWTLVMFRILTVLAGALIVWLAGLLLRYTSPGDSTWRKGDLLARALMDRPRIFSTAMIAAALIILWFFRGELGLESTSGYIRAKLGSHFTTEHFSIHYSRDSYDDEEIRWVAAEHEFRLHQVAGAFYLSFHGTIDSYIYPSAQAKQRLIGTGTTNIAKPWSGQIHITKQSLDGTLKHELTHVMAAPFGLPVIGASLSTGLVEGLAMAVEWDWGNRTLHQYAAAMKKFGAMPDIEPLMKLTGFAAQSSSVSYVVCGSFARFLIDRYGMRKMMRVYRSGDFPHAYGRTLHQLIGEWQGFLDRVVITDRDREAIDVIFRRPPIFRKVCARVLAAQNIRARQKYAEKDYKAAEDLYRHSYAEGRGYEALSGYLASALRSGNTHVVVEALDSIMMKDPNPSQYLPLFPTVGDAYWTLGSARRAEELYTRVRQADLSSALNESSALRSLALEDTSAAVRFYFMSDMNDTARLAMVDSILARRPGQQLFLYLKGRLLQRMMRFDESLGVLSQLAFVPRDSLLEALRLRMTGYDLFRLRKWEEAKAAFWNSLNFLSTEVAVNEMNDWLDRCEWMERYWNRSGSPAPTP